ncbi:MAG: hypothetical protein JW939_02780 [Candidatus Thermoplasmatota archaeon]|nr:hypothetical protein [Candidatus Thermoplasmatota archaeon]
MAGSKGKKDMKEVGDHLGPMNSFFISFLLWSILILPVSMGAFFMLEVCYKYMGLGNQYSVLMGLIVGLIISGVVGYIYSIRALKHME